MNLCAYNIATLLFPYDDPRWDRWKQLVPKVHERARLYPGFVDLYDGTATEAGYLVHAPSVMGNLSAWSDPDDLVQFTCREPLHAAAMRMGKTLFEPKGDEAHIVLYHADTLDLGEARASLMILQEYGPSEDGFGWDELKPSR